jgi:hypothetical protein
MKTATSTRILSLISTLSVPCEEILSTYGYTTLRWTLAAFQFLDLFTQSVGILGWGISPSGDRYLDTQDRTNTE